MAEQLTQGCQSDTAAELRFESAPLAVRAALLQMRDTLAGWGLQGDDLGSVELVLGEVLNNIVEHACPADGGGRITLICVSGRDVLRFCVKDNGQPLPNTALPEGTLPKLGQSLHELPEGGFGWFLVRRLGADLRYERKGGMNELSFAVPLGGR